MSTSEEPARLAAIRSIHGPTWRTLGASDQLIDELTALLIDAPVGTLVGRVSRVDRGRFLVAVGSESIPIDTSGVSPVCVGDWCTIGGQSGSSSLVLLRVQPRRTALVRQSSGSRTEVQALAANIDAVMVVVPLDRAISRR